MTQIYGLERRCMGLADHVLASAQKKTRCLRSGFSGPASFVLPASGRRYRVRAAGQDPALPQNL
ncbi:hypothetical protein [Stenotrophomonas maltophilia]|jgi:hypothetical protein|uniref:hypothetical protein n=1 Tax=Stenotrophomonas maltophilia TaxID=40324 RepID=UPI00106F91E5|nr:hypothetical protein [Stenotrophomonas maltophilia]MCU1135459.1 hypothetical protein [Stenotrophomonas maltophilia]HDS1549341.1 hypothetical protein [Stenotrophomonas maltophilia]